ncbi:hypothetical protein AGMMS49983_13980 [Clostridia bacterium]|nr:hypothetical protein AGMMS49983_13980 [Clostridia bacterium]
MNKNFDEFISQTDDMYFMTDNWTNLRVQIKKTIEEHHLDIVALNIYEWRAVENRIAEHFIGTKNTELFWMWENHITSNFKQYSKQVSEFSELSRILKNVINHDEVLWLFLGDTLHGQTKFWGYSGNIEPIVALLEELPPLDFYIVSKKLEWLIGQNHHDILFGFGEIISSLAEKVKMIEIQFETER